MRAFALVELGDRMAIRVYLRCEEAYALLAAVQPRWIGLLYVAPIELDERQMSPN